MVTDARPGLLELAKAAGLARLWRDVDGREREVSEHALAAILPALGHSVGSARKIKESLAELTNRGRSLPPMLVTEVGLATPVWSQAANAEVTGQDGVTQQIRITDGILAPIAEPGYYDLAIGGQTRKLAVAPSQCPLPPVQGRRMWGASLQIPALRSAMPHAFGGFGELADAAQVLSRSGCDALAINPVHALFPGFGEDFSPYSPSSRTFLNTAMGDPALLDLPTLPNEDSGEFIDWPAALPQRLTDLRQIFARLDTAQRALIGQANRAEGSALHRHAVFDALDCHFRPRGAKDWREWPARYRRPGGEAVARFASQHRDEIEFHLFAQWLAREGLAVAQQKATKA